jgi:triphosphatase
MYPCARTPKRSLTQLRLGSFLHNETTMNDRYSDADRKKLARLSARLKELQDALGSLNDFIAHRKMATDVALSAPPHHRRARALASGIMIGQEHEAAKALMKMARQEFDRLKPLQAKPV